MTTVRRVIELDAALDKRLGELAARRGQDVTEVIAEAVEIIESGSFIEGPNSQRTSGASTLSDARTKRFLLAR
ncbi:MAG: hypothetical protein WAK01_17670 [Methylocystis sp.]